MHESFEAVLIREITDIEVRVREFLVRSDTFFHDAFDASTTLCCCSLVRFGSIFACDFSDWMLTREQIGIQTLREYLGDFGWFLRDEAIPELVDGCLRYAGLRVIAAIRAHAYPLLCIIVGSVANKNETIREWDEKDVRLIWGQQIYVE